MNIEQSQSFTRKSSRLLYLIARNISMFGMKSNIYKLRQTQGILNQNRTWDPEVESRL